MMHFTPVGFPHARDVDTGMDTDTDTDRDTDAFNITCLLCTRMGS